MTAGRLIKIGWLVLALAFASRPARVLSSPRAALSVLNYYVDAVSGSDSNPGTSVSQPWRTIQKAANTVTAGAVVTVLPGNYPERVQLTQSGASGAPITFQAQGTVTMQGFTVTASYISLIGFDITNTPDNWQNGWGIFVEGTNCLIQQNYIHFATRGGITLYARPGSETQTGYCTVANNRLYRNAMAGMEIGGRNNLIEGNEVWGTIQHHPNWNNPPSSVDADGIRFFGRGHTIRNNYIHDISYQDPENVDPHIDCFQTWSGSGYEAAQNIVVEGNYCENLEFKVTAVGGQGLMLQGADGIIIRNNILWAFRGINAVGNQNLAIVNNTLASDLSFLPDYGPAGVSLTQTPNVTIKNNIFYNFRAPNIWVADSASQQGLDVGYNLTYRSDGQTPSGSAYPHDLWNVNPILVSPASGEFRPESNSPLIDAALALGSVTDDFSGAARPQGAEPDIGAFEFQASLPRVYVPLIYAAP